MRNTKNLLFEVNSLRSQMNLKPLTEEEFLMNEFEQLMTEVDDFLKEEEINEGFMEKAKYFLSKLGSYKAGGKIFGKAQVRARAAAQISAILDKAGNKMIKDLDVGIKKNNPEFPNNESQEEFLKTILEIATVYDSVVAATKLNPDDKGFLPVDAANEIIEDLRVYAQKYLDYDLTAIFTVVNELEDPDKDDIKVLDYGDPHKTKPGYADNPMPTGTGFVVDEADENLAANKQQVKDKFADTKAKVKSGELNAYDTERMKTLNSKRLPAILAGIGGALGALGWIAQTDWFEDLITTVVKNPAQFGDKLVQDAVAKNVVVDPNGWSYTLQNNGFMEETGKSLNFNQPKENLLAALKYYGGGNAEEGLKSMSQFLGDDNRAASASELMKQLNDPANKNIGDIFNKLEGTWGDKFFMNQNGGAKAAIAKVLVSTIKKQVIRGASTTATKMAIGAKLVAAAPALMGLGIALVAGAATVALARWKGKKSSRAQILNDLVQYIRPVEGTKTNPEVLPDDGKQTNANAQDTTNTGKDQGDTDTTNQNQTSGAAALGGGDQGELYDLLKAYFLHIFKHNQQTYGAANQKINQRKITQKVTEPKDIEDLMNLMEINKTYALLEVIKRNLFKEADDIGGLNKRELNTFQTHFKTLLALVNLFKNMNTNDKALNGLLSKVKGNPIMTMDLNQLLISEAEILKNFIREFNKVVYSTQIKDGENILDKLKSIGITKLAEANAKNQKRVIELRKSFLLYYPELIKSFYNVFSYLIKKIQSAPADQDVKSDDGKDTSNIGNTDAQASANELLGEDLFESRELIGLIHEHDKLMRHIYKNMAVFLNENDGFNQGKENAVKNSDSGRIFTQLSSVIPELTNKIAAEYKNQYDQALNRVKLGEFLQTIFGALAAIPQQRMVQIINRADMDVTAYKRMLKAIKTPEDGDQTQQDQDAENQTQQQGGVDYDMKNPQNFFPDMVGKYDLKGMNREFRARLAKRASEIIKRTGTAVQNRENMLEVMKQLLDDISKSGQKQLPTR